ncbi:M48 family metalloprotease [bacterium]|nr:M48 family metalloprotease [bacterium]
MDNLVANLSSTWDQFVWVIWLLPLLAVVVYPMAVAMLLRLSELTWLQKRRFERSLPGIDRKLASRLRIWNTGDRVCNAAVLGCIPGFSFVMISDALLNQLSPRGAAAIVAHEVGHLRLWHVSIRLAVVYAGGFFGMALVHQFESVAGWQTGIQATIILATFVYMTLMLHLVAPLLEFQADLYAVDMLSAGRGNRDACARLLVRTLSQLTHLSGLRPDQETWLYPSFEQRRRALLGLHSSTKLRGWLRVLLATIVLSQVGLMAFSGYLLVF